MRFLQSKADCCISVELLHFLVSDSSNKSLFPSTSALSVVNNHSDFSTLVSLISHYLELLINRVRSEKEVENIIALNPCCAPFDLLSH